MFLTNEAVREHQQTMLTAATEQRQGLRARALLRAARRARRAQRRLGDAQQRAAQLREELAAEQNS